jgi:hypothetical protein
MDAKTPSTKLWTAVESASQFNENQPMTMITTNQTPVKSAELTASNKTTILHLVNLIDGEELEKPLPSDCKRVQDFLDALNELPEYDLICTGWHYYYYNVEDNY